MARKNKEPVHHVQMTEGKRQIIQQLLQEYDIETAEDIQDALKDLLGGTIKEMMEAEMDDHLGYEKSERIDRSEVSNYRNGTKKKQVNSSYGTDKWSEKYPNAMKSWVINWDAITPIFKFSSDVRKVIYTTNAIESLNSTYRKLNRQRSVFPSDQALLKALYLATFEATKKWTMPMRNWGQVYGELSIMYEGRLPD